jgi:hypothetical protein
MMYLNALALAYINTKPLAMYLLDVPKALSELEADSDDVALLVIGPQGNGDQLAGGTTRLFGVILHDFIRPVEEGEKVMEVSLQTSDDLFLIQFPVSVSVIRYGSLMCWEPRRERGKSEEGVLPFRMDVLGDAGVTVLSLSGILAMDKLTLSDAVQVPLGLVISVPGALDAAGALWMNERGDRRHLAEFCDSE